MTNLWPCCDGLLRGCHPPDAHLTKHLHQELGCGPSLRRDRSRSKRFGTGSLDQTKGYRAGKRRTKFPIEHRCKLSARNRILEGYEAAASGDLIQRWEAISSVELFAPVAEHLPQQPSLVLDVGAGSGRDAGWLASLSHTVVAVEPVDALRTAGIERHRSPNITWLDDMLPHLSRIISLGLTFDTVLLCAVWQHLSDEERRVAFSAFRRLISEGGKIIMSIRHGAGAPTRPVFPVRISDAVTWAALEGFSKCCEAPANSLQAGNQAEGVTWTWLVFQKRSKS